MPASSNVDISRRIQDQIVNIPSEWYILTEKTLHTASIRNTNANNLRQMRRAQLGATQSTGKRSLKSFKPVGRSNQENAELSERGQG